MQDLEVTSKRRSDPADRSQMEGELNREGSLKPVEPPENQLKDSVNCIVSVA